jgi:Xaa-Pro aminopeptidase
MRSTMNKIDYRARRERVFAEAGTELLIISDPSSLSFLTGVELPFTDRIPAHPIAGVFASGGEALVAVPYELGEAVKDQGCDGELDTYDDNDAEPEECLCRSVSDFLRRRDLTGKLHAGFEANRMTLAVSEGLRRHLPKLSFSEIDEQLAARKMRKEEAACERLARAADQLEFGLMGAIQHLEGSQEEEVYTLSEFCERIRVHVYERGGTAGGLAGAAAGDGATRLYSLPRGIFRMGGLVRVESSSRFQTYWAVSSRMLSIGKANELQKRSFEENLRLKHTAAKQLLPGRKASDVYAAVETAARRQGIVFRGEYGVGHGIGTAEREEPFLRPSEHIELAAGMCVLVAVYTEGPKRELVCSKDSYRIDEGGPVCISSFHDWSRLYEVTGFRSAH